MRRRLLASVSALSSALAITSLAGAARAGDAAYCSETDKQCETAPMAFAKEVALPVQGGFDTGWVPAGSPLQVHLFAQLYANSFVNLQGNLVTTWPDALQLDAVPEPGLGDFGIHYGFEIGAQAHIEITVLGQTFQGTFDIPYFPQFDFQVHESTAFDPWAFDGVSVDGSTEQATIAQVSATDFIGLDIPGLDGGFALDTYVDLEATYRTTTIKVTRVGSEDGVPGGDITAEGETTSDVYANETSIDYEVTPAGEVVYDGILHLVPSFYISVIGQDFSIPIVDIPIPFNFVDKDWIFDPVTIHDTFPDIALGEGAPSEDDPTAPVVIDLGDLEIGDHKSVEVPIANAGEAELAGTADASPTADFDVTVTGGDLSIEPGAAASLSIAVSPNVAGDKVATVVVSSNDPDEPARVVELHAHVSEPEDFGEGGDGPGPSTDVNEAIPQGGGCACEVGATSLRGGGGLGAGLALAVAAGLSRSRRRARRRPQR